MILYKTRHETRVATLSWVSYTTSSAIYTIPCLVQTEFPECLIFIFRLVMEENHYSVWFFIQFGNVQWWVFNSFSLPKIYEEETVPYTIY